MRDTLYLLLDSVASFPLGFSARMSKDGLINKAMFSYHNIFSSN